MSNENAEKQGLVARLDNTAFARNHKELWTFVKFAAVSTICAAVEFAAQFAARALYKALDVQTLPGLFFFRRLEESTQLSPGYTLAMVVYAFMTSTAIGYMIGFFINRGATFHADGNIALGIFLNILLIIFTICANSLIGPWIEGSLPKLGFLPPGLIPALAKVLSMVATVVWIYPANRFLIHRKKKEVPADV
ncbi:MAG: hypothetical protein FWC27_12000 [Firmicutes bacterium]|nr:hypothetical protein [Bacillota bacterium]